MRDSVRSGFGLRLEVRLKSLVFVGMWRMWGGLLAIGERLATTHCATGSCTEYWVSI